jgi:hypothetical protein
MAQGDEAKPEFRVVGVEEIPLNDLLGRVRETRLRGHDQARLFADSRIELLRQADPEELAPTQRYVLEPDLAAVRHMYGELLDRGIDLLALEGGVWASVENGESVESGEPYVVPVIPPIVEESLEPDGRTVRIISDGMHRVYLARELGRRLNVIFVQDVPPSYPYYAYALPGGWSEVARLPELEDGFVKKAYREPANYKALFRLYNDVLPNVQKQRKKTNPGHLKE